MEQYRNINGDSGVSSFEVGEDFIKVRFKDSSTYLYNNSHTGVGHVNNMKILAKRGYGLNSYINTNVKYSYALKLS